MRVNLAVAVAASLLMISVVVGPGCGGGGSSVADLDPLATVQNGKLDVKARVAAVDRLADGGVDAGVRRESLKTIAWQTGNPPQVRERAIQRLAEDTTPEVDADTANMVRLMLPVEPNIAMVKELGDLAVSRRWTDCTGPLIRSWARVMGGGQDAERPERAAVIALNPGKPLDRVLFDTFATPATGEGRERERQEKTRGAAWALLSREDPEGSRRREWLAGLPATDDALVSDLRAAASDLRAIPVTASQLAWVQRLRGNDTSPAADPKAARAWWEQAKAALAGLNSEAAQGLALRHAEPVRWAAQNRPAWLALDRSGLRTELTTRMRGRTYYARGGGEADRLFNVEAKLAWADLLTLLVLDEALRTPGLVDTLWQQSERDRRDTSTEYGGLLAARSEGGGFVAAVYPPRPTQRFGDTRFVASDDLLRDSARALAHYHFHAQKPDNRDYAGPGPGDSEYAREHGAACIVFTPVGPGRLDATYFHAGGVTVDLGELAASAKVIEKE